MERIKTENKNEKERSLCVCYSTGNLEHQITMNPGDMESYYNLKVTKDGEGGYGKVLMLVQRTNEKRDHYFDNQKYRGYNDSKYFGENHNLLDTKIYRVNPDESLYIYSNGDLEIK